MRPFRRGAPASAATGDAGGGVATLEAPAGTSTKVRRRYDPAWNDWNPPRRWPGVLLSCLVVLGFLGIVIWHLRPNPPPVKHKQIIPAGGTLQKTFVIGDGVQGVLRSFIGTGSRVLPFSSNGGLLVLHAKCTCLYNFDVTIDQGFNEPVDIPLSATGNQNTALPVVLPKGNYQFQVVASGPWNLQLIDPAAGVAMLKAPFVYFSSGNTVLGPFSSADETLALAFLSNGHGNIEVQVLDGLGTSTATPFFGHSPYLRKVTIPNLPNPYFLQITSIGFWEIAVKTPAKG